MLDASFADGVVPLEVHVFLAERAVVIDSGTAQSPARQLIPALERLGVEPELLALTHAHEDHVGGAEPLRRRYPGLQVALHRDDVDWAESPGRFRDQLLLRHRDEWSPTPEQQQSTLEIFGHGACVDIVLREGDELDGTGLTVLAAPSHSPGHVVYWDESGGALFVGDAVQGRGVSLREGPGVFPMYLDIPSYLATLVRIRALEPDVVYTSHFGALDRAATAELLQASRTFVEELHEGVLSLLTSQPQRLADVARGVHAAHAAFQPGLQVHVTTYTHLQQLVVEGRARGMIVDGAKHWTRA